MQLDKQFAWCPAAVECPVIDITRISKYKFLSCTKIRKKENVFQFLNYQYLERLFNTFWNFKWMSCPKYK